ncbi:UNVERIFIED_CONTAM: hypothetical protein NCL1_16138 [Trichonephila clavipes]
MISLSLGLSFIILNKMAYTTDSYHSWIIVAASHIIHFFLFGMFRVGGLLYVEAMAIYHIDRETASVPFVVAYTLRCLSGKKN